MNKDLDERLVPKGEYREAQNILITQSEDSDVGAVENIQGNILAVPMPGITGNMETIGYCADVLNKRVFWFITDFTGDDGDIKTMSRADSTNTCQILMADLNDTSAEAKIIVQGHFLNFSKNHLITGVNLIDDLLFWTDNYNQPRKINVAKAIANNSHYVKEIQISVAKVSPYLAPILNDVDGNGDGTTLAYDESITSDYLKDKFVRFSYRYQYEDGEYSTIAPFTQIVFKPLNTGFIDNKLTTDRDITDVQDVYTKTTVDLMKNHYNKVDLRIPLPSIDNEINQNATWQNEVRIIKIEILVKESDQDVVKIIKEIDVSDDNGVVLESFIENIESFAQGFSDEGLDSVQYYKKLYKYTYKSEKPYKILEDKQITRVFDQVPLRAKAQEISGNRVIYGNFTENYNLPKDSKGKTGLNYVIRVNSSKSQNNAKTHALHSIKQNREYQVGVVLSDIFGRQSPVILSTATEDDLDPNLVIEQAIDTIKVEYVTSDLSETYTELDVASEDFGEKFYSWSGLNKNIYGKELSIVFNEAINSEDLYNGDIESESYNPYGWYSYKIVVKQQEQEYYNLYVNHPADNWNNEANNSDAILGFSWISLYGDNINKVPRDVNEVDEIREGVAGSDTLLFPKVVKSSGEESNISVMGIDQDFLEVMTVGTAREQGLLTDAGGDRDKDRVHDFITAKKNPLVAQVKSLNNSNDNDVLYSITVPVFESNEDDNSYVLVGDGNTINPYIRVGHQIAQRRFDALANSVLAEQNNLTIEDIVPERMGKLAQKIRIDNDEQGTTTTSIGGDWESKSVIADETSFRNEITKARVGQFIDYRHKDEDDNPETAAGFRYYGISSIDDFADTQFLFTTSQEVEHGDHNTVRYPIVDEIEFNDAGTRMSIHCDRKIFPDGIKQKLTQLGIYTSGNQMMGLYDPILIEAVETKSRIVNGEIKYFQRLKLSHDVDIDEGFSLIIQNIEEQPIAVKTGLTVLETNPVKSNLDIFFESSTCGLASEIRSVIDQIGFDTDADGVDDLFYDVAAKVVPIKYYNTFILSGGGTDLVNKPGVFHIEESRIKGGFNDDSVDLGVKAHIIDEKYAQRIRSNALIHSGVFNSKTKLNETNQFSIGESITKAVDVINGSIQKLYAEDTNLIIFQENKVSRALIDKDAIFTQEGQPLTTASKVVIGQVGSFGGKYGISKNPESFAVYGGRKYFSDKSRGTIMRLSQDGLTPISNNGMRSFFRDNLQNADRVYGMYDEQKNKYVVSLQNKNSVASTYNPEYGTSFDSTTISKDTYSTLSFDESSSGWVSFYTYKPTFGFSLSNEFYTYNLQNLYKHYSDDVQRCVFYKSAYTDPSNIEFVFNDQAAVVKNFHTIEYEGSSGWKMASAETDIHSAFPVLSNDTTVSSLSIPVNFINKENKYYGHIRNNTTTTALNQVVGVDLSGVKGYFNKVKMQYWKPNEAVASAVSKGELYAVNSETVYSSQ